jgi:hypothetical protein
VQARCEEEVEELQARQDEEVVELQTRHEKEIDGIACLVLFYMLRM